MSDLQKHKAYPKPDYSLPAWAVVVRETATDHEHFDAMHKICSDWQAARRKAEQAVGLVVLTKGHPALAAKTETRIGRGIPSRLASLYVIGPRQKVRYTLTPRLGYGTFS